MKTPVSTPDPKDLTCRELVELATDYVEDRLSLDERSRFEMHLCYCAPCGIYLQQIRSTIGIAGRLTEDDLEPGAREALLAAFRGWKERG